MKVFISWSGEVSYKVASALKDWLPYIFPAINPFVSAEDISAGDTWHTVISKELETSSFGIICVTRENLNSPWLNFEAGAISKSFKGKPKNKVCPFLFCVKISDIENHPIRLFQAVTYEKEKIMKLVSSINESTEDGGIEKSRLEEMFNTWWPKLEEKLNDFYKIACGKALLVFEDSQINAQTEIDLIKKAGYGELTSCNLDEQNNFPNEQFDLIIHFFKKTDNSTDRLRKVVEYIGKTNTEIPLIIYTYYANGNKFLSDDEVAIIQNCNYKMSNMRDTFTKLI